MLHPLLKRIAHTIPYTRRLQDGLEGMRSHILALEAAKARLQAQVDRFEELHCTPSIEQAPRPVKAARVVEAVHVIEHPWRDLDGVFVMSWAYAGPHPIQQVALICGAERAETDDLLASTRHA